MSDLPLFFDVVVSGTDRKAADRLQAALAGWGRHRLTRAEMAAWVAREVGKIGGEGTQVVQVRDEVIAWCFKDLDSFHVVASGRRC